MIDVLTNSFLQNPVPLQLTLNYCSHACSFCFANVNNPQRKADLKGILSILKNHRNRTDIVSYYLKEKYPILISNNIDPFSKNNYKLTEQIVDILLDLESNYLPMEKECIYHAWDKAIEAHDKRGHNISRSSCDVDDYYEETYNTESDGL